MDKQHRRIYAAPQAGYYPALLIAGGGLLLPGKRRKEMMPCNGLL